MERTRASKEELLKYYAEGMISYNELVCHLSELPNSEIATLKPSLKAQAEKIKRMIGSGETKLIWCRYP